MDMSVPWKRFGSVRLEGDVRPGFEPVREAFVENFLRRGELGGACCTYRDKALREALAAATAGRA